MLKYNLNKIIDIFFNGKLCKGLSFNKKNIEVKAAVYSTSIKTRTTNGYFGFVKTGIKFYCNDTSITLNDLPEQFIHKPILYIISKSNIKRYTLYDLMVILLTGSLATAQKIIKLEEDETSIVLMYMSDDTTVTTKTIHTSSDITISVTKYYNSELLDKELEAYTSSLK